MLVGIDQMKRQVRLDAYEARNLLVREKMRHLLRQVQVREAVSIVSQEVLLAGQMLFDGLEALADVGVQACVDKRNAPVADVAREQIELPPAFRQREIVRSEEQTSNSSHVSESR